MNAVFNLFILFSLFLFGKNGFSQCNVTLTAIATPNFICYEGRSALGANASNGQSPYTYVWSTGATGQTLYNQRGGTYTVTVTDGMGCTKSASVTVTQQPEYNITVTTTPSTGNDGTATANVTGGAGMGTYLYYWSSAPGQYSTTATGLSPGTLTVIITDAKTCTASASGTVAFISSITETDLSEHISVYPNPASSDLTINYPDISFKSSVVNIFNLQGNLLKAYSINPGSFPFVVNLESLSNGVYYLELSVDHFRPSRKKIIILK
jgi:hypothetical protein